MVYPCLSHFPLRKIPFSQASRSSVPALGKSPCPIARWSSNACSALVDSDQHLPVMTNGLPWKPWSIEIDALPIKNGDFH